MLQDRHGSGGKPYRPVQSILSLGFLDTPGTTKSYGRTQGGGAVWFSLSRGHMMFDPAIDCCDTT